MKKCLNETCSNSALSRGLCVVCYSIARRLVNTKQTTWEKLEKNGKAKPRGNRNTQTTEWLLK